MLRGSFWKLPHYILLHAVSVQRNIQYHSKMRSPSRCSAVIFACRDHMTAQNLYEDSRAHEICQPNCLARCGFVAAADLSTTRCQLRNVLLEPPLQNLRLNWKSVSWNRLIRTLIWTPTRTKIRYSKVMQQNALILIQERYHRITTWHINLVISEKSTELESVHTALKVRN